MKAARQLAVLQWLARFPLSGAGELAAFTALDSHTTNALVRELCAAGAIDWVAPESPELEPERLYYLTHNGVQVLARATGGTPNEIEERFPTSRREVLARLRRPETTVAVNRFFAALAKGLRVEEGVELADARYTHWMAVAASNRAPRGTLAFGCLRSGSLRAPFYLVWDRAGAPRIHRKLLVAEWYRAEVGAEAQGSGFPPILIVCPSQREAGQWASALDNSAARRKRPLVAAYVAMAADMHRDGPLGAFWYRPGGQRAEGLLDRLGWRPAGSAHAGRPEQRRSLRHGANCSRSMPPLRQWAADLVGSWEGPGRTTSLERSAALQLALSATQKSLLEWIGHHPLLSASDLATLLELREAPVARLLEQLVALRLIDSVTRPVGGEATAPPRYFLTGEGLRLLAARDGVPPRRYLSGGVLAAEDSARGVRLAGLLRHYEHTVGANGFAVGLAHEAAERRKRGHDHRLDAWMSAAEGQEWFRRGACVGHVWPDARLLYRSDSVLYDLFLEWDRALVRSRDYRRKLEAYGQFLAGLDEQSVGRTRVLFVTSTPQAEERIASVARAVGEFFSELGSVIYFTTAERVTSARPLGKIWRTAELTDRLTWLPRNAATWPPRNSQHDE